jgi:hypothetical protein
MQLHNICSLVTVHTWYMPQSHNISTCTCTHTLFQLYTHYARLSPVHWHQHNMFTWACIYTICSHARICTINAAGLSSIQYIHLCMHLLDIVTWVCIYGMQHASWWMHPHDACLPVHTHLPDTCTCFHPRSSAGTAIHPHSFPFNTWLCHAASLCLPTAGVYPCVLIICARWALIQSQCSSCACATCARTQRWLLLYEHASEETVA